MRYYSKRTGCTYLSDIHARKVPSDAVPITEAIYLAVIAKPAPGKIRSHDAAGLPILIEQPPPSPLTRDQIEAARLRAYADPLTGSDRYFAEAQRESLHGNTDASDSARAMGMARFTEIQAEYPWQA